MSNNYDKLEYSGKPIKKLSYNADDLLEYSGEPIKKLSYNTDELLEAKQYPLAYSKETIKNIKLISIYDDEAVPFGSYNLRIQKYPADIDTSEIFKSTGNEEEIYSKLALNIKKKVKKFMSLRSYYISEAKIGELYYYPIDKLFLGYLQDGNYIIADYQKQQILDYTTEFFKNNLFQEDDLNKVVEIMNKQNLDAYDYDVIFNIYRKYRVLRWSDKEIVQGYKKMMNGDKITLKDAIATGGHIKIDVIAKINNKFTELTNFLFVIMEKKDGENVLLNLTRPFKGKEIIGDLNTFILKRALIEIPKEIEKLFYSYYYYSPFKGIKRIWALARIIKDIKMLNMLRNIISGNISLLYQLKSELTNILIIFELIKSIPQAGINDQLGNIKERLWLVTELETSLVSTISEEFDLAIDEKLKYEKFNLIKGIKDTLVVIVNEYAIKLLKRVGLNTLHEPYLPKDISYNTTQMIQPEQYDNFKNSGGCYCADILEELY